MSRTAVPDTFEARRQQRWDSMRYLHPTLTGAPDIGRAPIYRSGGCGMCHHHLSAHEGAVGVNQVYTLTCHCGCWLVPRKLVA